MERALGWIFFFINMMSFVNGVGLSINMIVILDGWIIIFSYMIFVSQVGILLRLMSTSHWGGKVGGVKPNQNRWVDVTWDSTGKETSLANWAGWYSCSNTAAYLENSPGVPCHSSDCTWVSHTIMSNCMLSFVDRTVGKAYGCHCYGGNPWTSNLGVVCAIGFTL